MPLHRIPRTSAQAGIDARLLIDRCRTMQQGEFISYAELSALIGKDVQQRRDLLKTMRRVLRAQYSMVFDVEINEGLVCLSSAGIVGRNDKNLQRLYRAAGQSYQDGQCVDPDQLSPLQRYQWMAQQGIVMAVGLFTHPKTLAQHVDAQRVPQLPFNPDDYRDLFR